MTEEPSNSDVYPWRISRDESPSYGTPVLAAWNYSGTWHYRVVKFTGKRWLDVLPETVNEQYREPRYWQEIKAPL